MYTSVCKYCKRMFKAAIRTNCCADCRHLEKDSFEEILNYLRQFPNSNALQISQALNIPLRTIIQFIDNGFLTPTKGRFEKITEDSVTIRGRGD